jgi:KDO2-lipid IV(A) lauroyltransferase
MWGSASGFSIMSAIKQRVRFGTKRVGDAAFGALAVGLIKLLRLTDPDWLADAAGWTMRKVGPLLRENAIARAQLTAAFPEKSAAEIETILRGTWDNLGRMGAEFAHLDRLWDFQGPENPGRFDIAPADLDRFFRLAASDKPALVFAAHLGNWELPAISAHAYGVNSAVLYRGAHVGMLVDQYYVRGVPVTFFGRPTRANPLLARLARHFDCPIHGVRLIRLPGHRFRGDMTEAIAPVRDPEGKVDIAGTMQAIMNVIEGWIRENPEQWLWQHRRWRPEDDAKP